MDGAEAPARQKVAVVEDNDMLRELYSAVLESAGFDVSVFENGEAFLAEDDYRRFKVVLVDLQLGAGMHGVTLIRQLNQDRIKSIAITGSDPTLRSQALLTGAVVALPKPITNHSLILAVELALAL